MPQTKPPVAAFDTTGSFGYACSEHPSMQGTVIVKRHAPGRCVRPRRCGVTQLTGLTPAQVAERVAAGQTNHLPRRTSRPVGRILRANLLTWFNLILGTLWVLMLAFGSWKDALFGIVLIVNTAIGTLQELRARAVLDRLALISAPRAHVVRDGVVTGIAVEAVVLDDVLVLSPGDQVVADGVVLDTDGLEVDESALTGESAPVPKHADDRILSGSFIVAGTGHARATAVGADAYAMRLETAGREYTRVRSEVMGGINRILKWIGVAMVPVGMLTVFAGSRAGADLSMRVTDTVAALVSMVPEGLVLLSSLAFALSALALSRHKVLVNELPAVEGLARVDVVLADKTGTLTAREPSFGRVEMLGRTVDEAGAREALAALAAADGSPNPTLRAIATALQAPEGWEAVARVPFSSARKWSAIDFGSRGAWVLGAPDVVLGDSRADREALDRAGTLAGAGLRVLVLARARGGLEPPAMPGYLTPVALVVEEERMRPDAAGTLAYLREQGVEVKIVSGDNPLTVSRIAADAGLENAARAIDARSMDEGEALAAEVERGAVFGRVMPEQKAAMVSALQRQGHVVSMTGDGVNDVLALKQADLGIAMGSGVAAVRAVAQAVLLDDDFASVPLMMAEGRRVIANAERVANLFLTKSVWAMTLAVVIAVLGADYPFLPRQITLVGSLCIGIPAFFLALGPNARRYHPGFVRRVLGFALPAGAVIAVVVIGAYSIIKASGVPLDHARTMTTLLLLLMSLAVLAVLEWPLRGERTAIVAAMAAGGALAFAVPIARDFFALSVLSVAEAGSVVAASAAGAAAIAAVTAAARRTRAG